MHGTKLRIEVNGRQVRIRFEVENDDPTCPRSILIERDTPAGSEASGIEVRSKGEALIVWVFRPAQSERPVVAVGPWADRIPIPAWGQSWRSGSFGDPEFLLDLPQDATVRCMWEAGYVRGPLVPSLFSRMVNELTLIQSEHAAGGDRKADEDLQSLADKIRWSMCNSSDNQFVQRLYKALWGE